MEFYVSAALFRCCSPRMGFAGGDKTITNVDALPTVKPRCMEAR